MDNTAPIPQQTSQVPPNQASPQGFITKKKIIIFASALLLLIVIGVVGYFAATTFNSTEQPAEDRLMATVGDEEIYQSEVVALAQQQYQPEALDSSIINKFLGILIERTILDIEAENLGITVTDEEITDRAGDQASEPEKDEAKYALIKEKIIDSQTRNVSAHVIGFWVPSFDYPQLPEYETQRLEVSVALQDLFTRLEVGESPLEVAEYASQTYPDLPKLSLNGYIFGKTEQSLMQQPQTFVVGELDPEGAAADPDLYEAFETAENGDVLLVIRTDGSGGSVAKVENITVDGYSTYDEFIQTKTEELVDIHFQP